MRSVPRKNWRGFIPHVWSMLEILIKSGEFPRIRKNISTREFISTKRGLRIKEHLDIGIGEIPLTFVVEEGYPEISDSFIDRTMAFCENFGDGYNLEEAKHIDITFVLREKWLKLDDEEINRILRHELLHYEMDKKDCDIEFLLECERRNLPINKSSGKVFYAYEISQDHKCRFNRESFDYCFSEGFDYWAKFAKYMRIKSSISQDVKIAQSTLTDSHLMAKGQFGTRSKNVKCKHSQTHGSLQREQGISILSLMRS